MANKKKPKKRKAFDGEYRSASITDRPQQDSQPLLPIESVDLKFWLPTLAVFAGALLFAYWPTFVWMEDSWRNEPDYSHGYLVPILAGILCWNRLDLFPGVRSRPSWAGIWLIAIAIAMRVVSQLGYLQTLDGWSLLPLLAGVIWVLFGVQAMKWSLPAIGFLLLMVPLPYRAETLLSWRLQGFATELSTVFLRILGQPAVSEGHLIWINEQRLMVEQACSGLRIFVGVAALAYFWAAMVKRSWLDRLVILTVALPLAVFVNALRITTVGILNQWFTGPASKTTIHDLSGYLMIPLAFGLLWLVKSYWEHLYRPVQEVTARDLLRGTT